MSDFDQNIAAREKLNELASRLVPITRKIKRLAQNASSKADAQGVSELNNRAGAYAQEMLMMSLRKDDLDIKEAMTLVELVEYFIETVDAIPE